MAEAEAGSGRCVGADVAEEAAEADFALASALDFALVVASAAASAAAALGIACTREEGKTVVEQVTGGALALEIMTWLGWTGEEMDGHVVASFGLAVAEIVGLVEAYAVIAARCAAEAPVPDFVAAVIVSVVQTMAAQTAQVMLDSVAALGPVVTRVELVCADPRLP